MGVGSRSLGATPQCIPKLFLRISKLFANYFCKFPNYFLFALPPWSIFGMPPWPSCGCGTHPRPRNVQTHLARHEMSRPTWPYKDSNLTFHWLKPEIVTNNILGSRRVCLQIVFVQGKSRGRGRRRIETSKVWRIDGGRGKNNEDNSWDKGEERCRRRMGKA